MQNDAKDRHVLATAARAKAAYLVTYSLRHFPKAAGAFLNRLYAKNPERAVKTLYEQAADIRMPIAVHLKSLHLAVPAFAELIARDTGTTI